MSIWEILVPTVMPNGRPIRTRQHRVWDERVRQITGGLTIMPPVYGQWVSSTQELFLERMIPVRIACTKEQINTIADMTAKFYNQLAIMFYQLSNEVFIKKYEDSI